ncbi:RNase P subunit p30 family protein [Thermoproteota archaeon]
MKPFIDLFLRPIGNPRQLLDIAYELGFGGVGLASNEEHTKLDVIHRIDLDPTNTNELLRALRKSRWNTEVITVNCRSKSVARQAGKDRRVDLISFPVTEKWEGNHLDRQQAGLMQSSGCGYFIDLSLLMIDDRYLLRKRIEFLKRNLQNAMKREIPVVASSGATDVWGLRDPHSIASLLGLLNVDEANALEMISANPKAMIDKNRGKLKDSYIVSGVCVIKDE